MAVTARKPLLERVAIPVRKFARILARALTLFVLAIGVIAMVSEVSTWVSPDGFSADAPPYAYLSWLGLIIGPGAFLFGLERWSQPTAMALRVAGWMIMFASLSLSSLSDFGLVLLILLTPFLHRFREELVDQRLDLSLH